jgi:hypothetical protein
MIILSLAVVFGWKLHQMDVKTAFLNSEVEQEVYIEQPSILKSDVWVVVPRPRGKSVVTSKWIYKIKHTIDGSVEKFKVRFVARGFSQKEGIDYDEIFAPVARYTSIRIIISLAAVFGWKLH